jgi:hypothetical protein
MLPYYAEFTGAAGTRPFPQNQANDLLMCCKAPVMTIEKDGKTITLAESGAIIEFIINKYGPQLAPDPADECVLPESARARP